MHDLGLIGAGASAVLVVSAMLAATTHGIDHRVTLRLWCAALVVMVSAIVLLTVI